MLSRTTEDILEPIVESEMKFGPFLASQVFRIEKDSTYTSSFQSHGIKTCEFILRKDGKLYFVEAKKSCPNYSEAKTSDEKRKKYEEYVRDISQKMRDSLNLYTSMLLKVNQSVGIPNDLKILDWENLQIRFVLVVKNAQSEWLAPYQDIFREYLRNEMKIWNVPLFAVITEQKAREKKLIFPDADIESSSSGA